MKLNFKNFYFILSLVLCALIAILFEPVVFGGKMFGSADTLSPRAIGTALNNLSSQAGSYPHWQPWIFSGMPTAEAFSYLSKLYFPEYIFKLFFIPGIIIQLFHMVFAGVGVMFLLRNFKCSRWASALGSISYMITPYMITMVVYGHGSQIMTAAYIPWVLWLTVRLWETPNSSSAGWLAVLLGFQLQRAHVQVAYYAWLLIGFYIFFMLIISIKSKNLNIFTFKKLGLFIVACTIGLGIASLIYLPAIEYAPFSIRGASTSGGAEYNYATSWSFHPKEILTFFIPSAFGFGGQPYWGFMPFTDYPNYMGIIVLLLAVTGLFKKLESIHWFFIITSILAIFISFGKHFSPLYNIFYNFFPYFSKFRVPHMILILLQLNIAILSAFGLDQLFKNKKFILPKWFLPISGIVVSIFILLVFANDFIHSVLKNNFPVAGGQDIRSIQILNNIRWEMWQFDAWIMIFFSGAFLVLFFLWFNGKVTKLSATVTIVILSIIDLVIVDQKIIQPSRSSGRQSQLIARTQVERFFEEDSVVSFLKKDDSNFRIYPTGPFFGESRFAAFGLESVGGYHPAKLNIYNNLLNNTGNLASIPVLRMLNVKYLIAPQSQMINHPKLTIVNTGNLKSSRGSIPSHVYKIQNFMPRAWFVQKANIVKGNEVFERIVNKNFNPLEKVYLNKTVEFNNEENGKILSYERLMNKIIIKTSAKSDQLLVVSEVYYPLRWKAFIDNREVEVLKANGILRALKVPAGDRNIEFIYDTSSFDMGVLISFISLILAFSFILFSHFKPGPK